MQTTPAETCNAHRELRSLCLTELSQKAYDSWHGDTEAILEQERPEAMNCAADIRPSMYQQNRRDIILIHDKQVLEVTRG